MQAEQRKKIDEDRFDPQEVLWDAFTVHGEDGTDLRHLDIDPDTNYVAIEEIEDGRVVFAVSAWPNLDEDGRLVFREIRPNSMSRSTRPRRPSIRPASLTD